MSDYFSLFFGIASFVALWAVALVIISRWSGWAALAELYRSEEAFPETRWRFQRGQFRWLCGYNNCLTIAADPRGLYLSLFPLFRVAHPPLFIPWREISVARKKTMWVKQMQFALDRDLRIPLTILERIGLKVQEVAGSAWPEETTPLRAEKIQ